MIKPLIWTKLYRSTVNKPPSLLLPLLLKLSFTRNCGQWSFKWVSSSGRELRSESCESRNGTICSCICVALKGEFAAWRPQIRDGGILVRIVKACICEFVYSRMICVDEDIFDDVAYDVIHMSLSGCQNELLRIPQRWP